METGKIVVHKGRAHVDDYLASCVCLHRTGLPLFRSDTKPEHLEDPDCWVLDQGMRFEPELHNFDHHHLDAQVCSLTMLLDHFYGPSYRTHIPQLSYIEIHDSVGASKAAKFAGITYEQNEIASSLIQNLVLRSFSKIEGKVEEDVCAIMSSMGSELCRRIESIPSMLDQLDKNSRLLEASGFKVLDVTQCFAHEPDQLPTKSWCKQNGLCPSIILTKDSRMLGSYRMISTDKKVNFASDPRCRYTHASGFMTVFDNLDDWQDIIKKAAC